MTVPEIEGLTNLRELGRGGFGVVYRAHQPAFGRDVAVKVITGGSVDPAAISRFERECRATGAVSGHPNIVRVHDAGVTSAGDPYLVMDLLPNGTLAQRVEGDGTLDGAAAVTLGIGLAGALETAHRSGIIHRDVKPENVLFSAFGDAQLADFGIARMQDAYETKTGSVSATLAHAAPEVIAGAGASARSDIYSLGSVLYYALAGATPFGRAGEQSLLPLITRISSDPVPDLRGQGVPDALASVVERAMAKAADDRFGSALEMGEALREAAVANGLPAPAVPIADPDEETLAVARAVPSTEAGAVTGATFVRQREAVQPVLPIAPPEPAGMGRGRVLALAAVALAVVLLLLALVVLRADDDEGGVTAGGTTTTSSTSTTTSTTSTPDTTDTTTVEPAVTTEPPPTLPVVIPTTPPTRGTTPSTPTQPPATTTTKPPTRTPDAVTDLRSADPVAVDEINGVPQHVRITLTWRAPADNGGSGPTAYRVRCTLMQGSAVYTGEGHEPAPCRGGIDVGTAPEGASSFQPAVQRVEPGPGTWIKWEVIPQNEAGEGPPAAARPTVPNFVGLKTWQAYPFGRVVGVAIGGAPPTACGRERYTVCEQSRSAGENVPGGATVSVSEQG